MTTVVRTERGKLRTVITPQTSYGNPVSLNLLGEEIVPTTMYVPDPIVVKRTGYPPVEKPLGPFVTPAVISSSSKRVVSVGPKNVTPLLSKQITPSVNKMANLSAFNALLEAAVTTHPVISNPSEVIISGIINDERYYLTTTVDDASLILGQFKQYMEANHGTDLRWEDAAGYLYQCFNSQTELYGGYYGSPSDDGDLIELTDEEKTAIVDAFYANSSEYDANTELMGTINEWAKTIPVPETMTVEQSIPFVYFLPDHLKDYLMLLGPAVMQSVIGNNGDDCELEVAIIGSDDKIIDQYIEYLADLAQSNSISLTEVFPVINNYQGDKPADRWFVMGTINVKIWNVVISDPLTALKQIALPAYQVGYYGDKLWITPLGKFALYYRVNYVNLTHLYYGYARDLVNCAIRHGIKIASPYQLGSLPSELSAADAQLMKLTSEDDLVRIRWYDINGLILFDHYLQSLSDRETPLMDHRNFYRDSAASPQKMIPVDRSQLSYHFTNPKYQYSVPLLSWIQWGNIKVAALSLLTTPLLSRGVC